MSASIIYGVVYNGTLYSNRIERPVGRSCDNGIYSLDMEAEDFWSTLTLANIVDAIAFFRKASRISVIRGISFHNGVIPDNPVAFAKIPLKVEDSQSEEYEYVEVANVRNRFCYFLQTLATKETYALMDVKECFEKEGDITKIKDVTPAMRMAYSFHMLERKRRDAEEPQNFIKESLRLSGAEMIRLVKRARGYEVTWRLGGHVINTMFGFNYRVLEAGFCVSGYDKDHTIRSLPSLLQGYVEEGSYIHLMRTVGIGANHRPAEQSPDDYDDYDDYDD